MCGYASVPKTDELVCTIVHGVIAMKMAVAQVHFVSSPITKCTTKQE